MSKVAIVLCLVALALNVNAAVKDLVLGGPYNDELAECTKTLGLPLSAADKEFDDPNNTNTCFVGCALKKAGVINSAGDFDVPVGMAKVSPFLESAEKITQVKKLADECTSVNSVPVKDVESGCERGKLIIACFQKAEA